MKKTLSLLALLMLFVIGIKAQTALFDFENNSMKLPVGEGQDFTDGALAAPITVDGVTLTSVQGEAFYPAIMMKDNNDIVSLNVYKNGAIKLNAAEGKALTKIEATMKNTKTLSQMTATNGATTDNIWEGNAAEVTFSASALMSFLKIGVTVADENEETVKPVVETFDVEAADIAAFRAAEDGKVVKLQLDNVQVNAIDDIFNFAYVEDATGAIEIAGITLTAGTVLNGYIIGTKSSDALDFANPDFGQEIKLVATADDTFEAATAELKATATEVADIAKAENHGRLMVISQVEIKKEGRFYYAYSGEDKVQVKDAFSVLPTDYEWPEKAKSITGLVTFNGARFQIAPLQADAIVVEVAGETTALFDFANNNGEWPMSTSEDINAGNLEGVALVNNDVTLTFVSSPTMPTRYYVNGTRGPQLQLIKDGQMRITAKEGFAITAVRAKPNESINTATGAVTTQVNWVVDKGEGTLSGDKLSWTGNATSVRFNATGATYLDAIEVDMAPADEETVTPEADTYTEVSGLADFNALADGTLTKLTLTDAVITSGMANEWGYYVQDATAAAHFYCTGLKFQVNDVVSGTVYVKKSKQNMGSRIAMTEDTNADGLTIAHDGTVVPVEGTVAEVNIAENLLKVVRLTGVSLKATKTTEATLTDAEGNTLTVNNGTNNYYPYVVTVSFDGLDLQQANVTAILVGSTKGNQLYPLAITKTIAMDKQYATFSSTAAFDFTDSGIIAYTAVVNGKTVTLTPTAVVPAKTGVLLKAQAEKQTVELPIIEAEPLTQENDFVAVAEEMTAPENAYILATNEGVQAFYKANGNTIAAGKAYLASDSEEARLTFSLDGQATAIDGLSAADHAERQVYNLNGLRVRTPQKGLYIVSGKNGKKTIIR